MIIQVEPTNDKGCAHGSNVQSEFSVGKIEVLARQRRSNDTLIFQRVSSGLDLDYLRLHFFFQ